MCLLLSVLPWEVGSIAAICSESDVLVLPFLTRLKTLFAHVCLVNGKRKWEWFMWIIILISRHCWVINYVKSNLESPWQQGDFGANDLFLCHTLHLLGSFENLDVESWYLNFIQMIEHLGKLLLLLMHSAIGLCIIWISGTLFMLSTLEKSDPLHCIELCNSLHCVDLISVRLQILTATWV